MYKVLIVEDEQLVARMFQKTLEADGFEVQLSSNGSEGIAKMKSWKPDLVLMDMMMPKTNGIQALEEIQKDPEIAGIRVVMLTNLSGKHDAELAISKGAFAYLIKKDAAEGGFSKKITGFIEKKT